MHVHEIPDGLKLAVFRRLLNWTRAEAIFNSKATRAAYALPAARPQHVVYNGVAAPSHAQPGDYDGTRPLRLLMLGRINRIKGQDLLIEALALLPHETAQRLDVRIVGETFENDRVREEALRTAAREAGLESVVRFEPFCADPAPLYRWADVVAVPSRLPEALGRVAIEAMAHRRPPLVARIGGLPETVEDRVSGWIVAPNDAAALARTLRDIVAQPEDWRGYGAAARHALRGDIRRARHRPPAPGNRSRAPDRKSRNPRRARSRAGVAMHRDLIGLIRNFILSLGGEGMQSGFHFVLNLILIRMLSAYDFGIFAIAFVLGGISLNYVNALVSVPAAVHMPRLKSPGAMNFQDVMFGSIALVFASLIGVVVAIRPFCHARARHRGNRGRSFRRIVDAALSRAHRDVRAARDGRGDAVGYQLHGKRHRAGGGRALARSGG